MDERRESETERLLKVGHNTGHLCFRSVYLGIAHTVSLSLSLFVTPPPSLSPSHPLPPSLSPLAYLYPSIYLSIQSSICLSFCVSLSVSSSLSACVWAAFQAKHRAPAGQHYSSLISCFFASSALLTPPLHLPLRSPLPVGQQYSSFNSLSIPLLLPSDSSPLSPTLYPTLSVSVSLSLSLSLSLNRPSVHVLVVMLDGCIYNI